LISVGCDFGLRKSGIVLLNDGFQIESQNLIRIPETVKGAQRLVDIERGFDSIITPYRTEKMEVFVEGYAYGAKYQRESLAELGGVIRRYLHLARLNFWIIPPTSLKLFVTGTGKATKNYMKKCTKENWGEIFKSDDVCDAYGMSQLGMNIMRTLNGEPRAHLEKTQLRVIDDILTNQDFYKNSNTARKKKNVKRSRQTQSTLNN